MSLLDLPQAPRITRTKADTGKRYGDEDVARIKAAGRFLSYKTISEETGIPLSSVTYWCCGYYKKDIPPCEKTLARIRAAIRGE